MMKKLLTLIGCIGLFATTSNAQLPNGSIAPDFTATDLNGNTYHLYDLLDQGMTVFLDVSATWCGPCWSYHNSHKLRDLYDQYGPTGTVTPNKVMVFFAEGDSQTSLADLNGTGGNTQGNWVTGTTYPILHTEGPQIGDDYQITYFPTLYVICPNRVVNMFSQSSSVAALYGLATACPTPQSMDAYVLPNLSSKATCQGGNVALSCDIANLGTTAMTSATVEALVSGTPVATNNWTGNLGQAQSATVSLGNYPVSANTTLTYRVTQTGDMVSGNNTATQSITTSNTAAAFTEVKFALQLDQYPGETTWRLTNTSTGVNVASGGPYSTANQLINQTWTLNNNECYVFHIEDAYGDGICCGYGNGSAKILNMDNTVVIDYSGNNASFDVIDGPFKSGITSNVDAIQDVANNIALSPNPASSVMNFQYNLVDGGNVTLEVYNAVGQRVYNIVKGNVAAGFQSESFDVNSLAVGAYTVRLSVDGKSTSKRFIIAR